MNSESPARTASGISTLWDVIVAPRSAFSTLRDRPYIGWAFLITCIIGMAGALVQVPALEHVTTAMWATLAAHDPQVAALTPEQQQRQLALAQNIQHWYWLFYPVLVGIGVTLAALTMLVLNAIGRGDGNFRRCFSLAVNVAIVNYGLGYLVVGLVTLLRGPEAFSSTLDVLSALPSLLWLAPGAPVKLATFLASFQVFQIWSMVLLALGMQTTLRLKAGIAWTGAFLLILIPAAIGASFAR